MTFHQELQQTRVLPLTAASVRASEKKLSATEAVQGWAVCGHGGVDPVQLPYAERKKAVSAEDSLKSANTAHSSAITTGMTRCGM